MPKILLAEDDANLREIFEMRLKAEGFDVVTAGDGEEALVVATKEMPDLIVVDIMMPKISGFEMLETLRTNPATANIRAIMMTALGQADDRDRGAKLGVLKYLVKSQVTLEDFVRTIKEVLGINQTNNQTRSNMDDQTTTNPMGDDSAVAPPNSSGAQAEPSVPAPTPAPAPDATDMSTQAVPADEPTMAEEASEVKDQEEQFASAPADAPAPTPAPTPAPAPDATDMSTQAVPADEPTMAQPADPSMTETPPEAADSPAQPGETISPDGQSTSAS